MTDEMDEIWLLYVDDGSQSLDAVERAVTQLREHPSDTAAIGLLFRSMHTFKGNSRVLGLATIEQTAHVAEDLIGIVRDEGIPIDNEIIDLLIEAADALRAMMDRAYRSRSDAPADAGSDLPARLKDKIERCRAGDGAQPATKPEMSDPEFGPAEDDAPFAGAILFDAAGVRLADDPVYRQIFFETARASLDLVHETIANGASTGLHEHLLSTIADIRDMAERINMPEWPEASEAAETALRANAGAADVLARLEDLYRLSLDEDTPSQYPSSTADHRPAATAQSEAMVPESIVSALTSILVQANAGDNIDRPAVVALAGEIARWATANGLPGITDVCESLAAAAAGNARIDASAFRLADYLSRFEDDPDGAATRQLAQWSFARTSQLLGELSHAVGRADADWHLVAGCLEDLGPACAGCGWHAAREVVQLLADICCRVRDGEIAADTALPGIMQGFVGGLRLALENRADGEPDFAAADAILTETASAAERLFRDPALAELAISVGLPTAFHGALSHESAQSLKAAIDDGQNLYVIRADLGQDEVLAASFMDWLASPGHSCICSITVYLEASTAFDFLVASHNDQQGIQAALSKIAKGSGSLSLVVALAQHSGMPSTHADELELEPASDGNVDADALSEIVGELAIARSATRQVLAGFVEADLPTQVDRMLQELISDPRMLREELSRLLHGWQEKFEQLLQVEAKATTDLDQLSEIAARLRQRPAGTMLDRIAAWIRERVDETGASAEIKCGGRDCAIDISHISPMEAALRQTIECSLTQESTISAIDIEVAQRETAVEATVTVTHRQNNGADQPNAEADHPQASPEGVDVLLSPVAGYAVSERLRGAGIRTRLVIPRRASMIDGMIVRVSDTKYVLPVHSIQRIVETTRDSVVKVSAQSAQTLVRLGRDEVLPVQSLHQAVSKARPLDAQAENACSAHLQDVPEQVVSDLQLFVITATRDGKIAVPVDELLGQEPIVVRPVQGYLGSLRAVTGCTILAAGDVGIVVDPNAITRSAAA